MALTTLENKRPEEDWFSMSCIVAPAKLLIHIVKIKKLIDTR